MFWRVSSSHKSLELRVSICPRFIVTSFCIRPATRTATIKHQNIYPPIENAKAYVSLRLRVQNAVTAQPCVGKLGISLVLLNFLHCNFRLWFKTPLTFDSYPCHVSEMTRNTLNHCLKFALNSIFCHICYGKISEKSFSTVIKDKLLVCKASNSYFKGLDFFQMLLASHR